MNFERYPNKKTMSSRKSRKQQRSKVFQANSALVSSRAKKARKGS